MKAYINIFYTFVTIFFHIKPCYGENIFIIFKLKCLKLLEYKYYLFYVSGHIFINQVNFYIINLTY